MRNKLFILLSMIMWFGLGTTISVYAYPAVLADQYYKGHEYRIILSNGIPWLAAYYNAINTNWYLATITSQQEQNFIISLISIAQSNAHLTDVLKGLWLGGNFTSSGQKVWVDGEVWNYENWGASQPSHPGYIAISAYNNCGGGCCGGHCCPNVNLGEWYIPYNNTCGGCNCCPICGYIEERGATVPEPTTLFLLGGGILGVLECRRRKRLS